jgi:hypothetical protein
MKQIFPRVQEVVQAVEAAEALKILQRGVAASATLRIHYKMSRICSFSSCFFQPFFAFFVVCLVGAVGIEPTTFGLKGRCSTTELRPWDFHRREFSMRRLLILTFFAALSNRHFNGYFVSFATWTP